MPDGKKVPQGRHMVWYREIVPATLPVLFLGTGIFFTLTLLQTHLSHSRSLDDSAARITALEDELRELRESQQRQAVNWSAGLGTVVRRVRDLGREVHHVADHVVEHSSEPAVQPEPPRMGITQRLLEKFGNPFRSSSVPEVIGAVESKVDHAGHVAGEKMDHLRDVASRQVSEFGKEVSHRVDTLPARADPTTASPTLASRLMSTFGNPRKDDVKVQEDLRVVKASAENLADEALDTANAAKQRLENVDLHDVKQTLVRAEEKIEDAVTPLAIATAQKMDTIRETATQKATELADEMNRRVETLPARADPTTANPSLASRLLATFGNPRKDDVKVQEDLQAVKASAEHLADEAIDAASVAKQRLENVDLAEIKQTFVRAEEKVEEAVTPLAIATGQKMDTIRETATQKATELADEMNRRVETLPARADPTTANPSLASRLLATFGNPRKDDVKVHEDLQAVKASAEHLADEAIDAANAAKQRLQNVDLRDVKQALYRAEEKVEDAVTPLAVATGQKMDELRETVTARASNLTASLDETLHARLDALPERGIDNPAQGIDPVLASRLVATFGNPVDDARLTRREVGDAVGLGNVVRMEEGVAAAKEGLGAAQDVVGEVVDKVEQVVDEKRARGWWS